MMNPIVDRIILVALLIAAGCIWWAYTPAPAPVQQWQPAKVAPQVKDVPKEAITPPKVVVYHPKAKAKLDLPPDVQQDPHSHVIDAVSLPADDHPQTVTTLIDDQTGETHTIVRREPLPWFALEDRGSAGIYYGIKRGLPTSRLIVTQDIVQIKSLHLGATASVDSDGQLFAGVGVVYRW